MPVKDNIQSEKQSESFFENEEEKRRKAVQNVSEVKPQKLLSFLNMKAEFHQSRIDTLDEKIAARQDKIARNEAKIERLSAIEKEGEDDSKSSAERDSLEEECDFCVYDDIKKKLIDKGIPESEIAYVHDAKTEKQKSELFDKVRSGNKRGAFHFYSCSFLIYSVSIFKCRL